MIRHYYIQCAELSHEYDLSLNTPFYYGTSMLMVSIQIVIRQMLYVIFFFFQNSYYLTILLKQTVFYQLFYINQKHIHRNSDFYQ